MFRPTTTLGACLALGGLVQAQDQLHHLSDPLLNEAFGSSVCALGDVDGDGATDFAVGDYGSPAGTGGVVAYSGVDAGELYRLASATSVSGFGFAMASVDDLDGDGVPDLAVSAPAGALSIAPNATIDFFSGATGAPLPLVITGDKNAAFGSSLVSIPDVDGDGLRDLAVGCPADSSSAVEAGAVRVFSTNTGAELYHVYGNNPSDLLGKSLAMVGDLNNDGVDEYLAGAPGGEYAMAIPYNLGLPWTISPGVPARDFGFAVAGLGDLDNDGVADYAIGAPADAAGPFQAGNVRVYSGQTSTVLYTLLGDFDGDRFGTSVCNAGDVNNDGVDDVAVGATLEYSGSFFPAGLARISSGVDGSYIYSAIGGGTGALFGACLADLGDVDGDTRRDLLVGSPGRDEAFVISRGRSVGTAFCFGDGSGAACPCANFGASGEGCASSMGYGSSLLALGSDFVSDDFLVLMAISARPNMPGLFLQGASQIETPFKDGLLCMGNPTERLQVVFTDAEGTAISTASIVTEGNVTAGDTRYYQYWFRDAGGVSPCGTGSNFSSAVEINWF
ncbi:MAG: FG-GAP repeat protein [Planctomycetes bacterium]|nr:FG-GAP repeat protein [Planctomycetota bacterium]